MWTPFSHDHPGPMKVHFHIPWQHNNTQRTLCTTVFASKKEVQGTSRSLLRLHSIHNTKPPTHIWFKAPTTEPPLRAHRLCEDVGIPSCSTSSSTSSSSRQPHLTPQGIDASAWTPHNKRINRVDRLNPCDNILHGYRCVFDLAFSHFDGIYGFKFPSKFLEISCRDLTSFAFLSLN